MPFRARAAVRAAASALMACSLAWASASSAASRAAFSVLSAWARALASAVSASLRFWISVFSLADRVVTVPPLAVPLRAELIVAMLLAWDFRAASILALS